MISRSFWLSDTYNVITSNMKSMHWKQVKQWIVVAFYVTIVTRILRFPSGCLITETLIRYYHVSNYHCGMDRTISIIRDRYFIIGLRRSVKKLVNQCRICILKRRKAIEMSHGQVPPFRYDNTHPPFFNTGIDLFGPLKVKFTTPRKRHGVIF